MTTVTPKQLKRLLVPSIQAKELVLIKGKPGVGKSAIEIESAAEAGAENIIMYPSVADPTDAKGFPFMVDGVAKFVPFDDLKRVFDLVGIGKLAVLFLDDLGQGSPAVQASFMQLIDRIRGKIAIIAATNRRSDRAGVQGLLEPVKSRFSTIVELEVSLDDWVEWAFNNNVPASVIGFLRNRPELLSKFEPTADITNSPSPRTWAALGRMMTVTQNDTSIRQAVFSGAVGEADATAFLGFLEILEKAPDPDYILMDPEKAKLPLAEDPGIAYAVALALAYRANQKNFGSIAIYAKRMYAIDGLAEFSALLLRDSARVIGEKEISQIPAFMKLAGEPVAKALFAAIGDGV